jgi:HEAT repeat protein
MSEESGSGKRPRSSRRLFRLWGGSLLFLMVLGFFCWAVVVPVWQVEKEVSDAPSPYWGSHPILGSNRDAFLDDPPGLPGTIVTQIERLGGPERAATKLALYLRMPDWTCSGKANAAELLACCGRRGAPGVFRALNHGNSDVRFSAALILSRLWLESSAHVPDLDKALDDPNPQVRVLAALMLSRLHKQDDGAHRALLRALTSRDDLVVEWAARSFARNPARARTSVPQLARVLRRSDLGNGNNGTSADTPYGIHPRIAAARALAAAGTSAADATDELAATLTHPDAQTREAALEALRCIGPGARSAVPALIEFFKRNKGHRTGDQVLEALGNIGEAAQVAIPELLKVIRTKDSSHKWTATRVLGSVGPPAYASLADLLDHEDGSVRHNAALAFRYALTFSASVPGARRRLAVPCLLKALSRTNCSQSEGLIEALGQIGPGAHLAIPELIKRVHYPNEASQALARIGRSSRPALMKLLNDKNLRVRHAAARTLTMLEPDSRAAVRAQVHVLKNSKGWLQRSAACALGQAGPHARNATPLLAQLLDDPDQELVRCAAEAIGKIGHADKKTLTKLSSLAQGRDRLATIAGTALRKLSPRNIDSRIADLQACRTEDRVDAARMLVNLGLENPRVAAKLEKFLAEEKSRGRLLAAWAHWKISGRDAELRKALHSSCDWSGFSKEMLAEVAALAVPMLHDSLRKSRKWDIIRDANALETFGPAAAPAVRTLISLLEKEDRTHPHSEAVAKALGAIGPKAKAAAPALTGLLAHYDLKVRVTAATAVWRITGDTKRTVPALVSAIHKTTDLETTQGLECQVVTRACATLEEMGTAASPALPYLRSIRWRVSNRELPEMLHAAIMATFRISGNDPKMLPSLCLILNEPYVSNRCYKIPAARALGDLGAAGLPAAPLLEALTRDEVSGTELPQIAAAALRKIRASAAARKQSALQLRP